MATKKTQPGITGIEPGQMAVPAMDRPSIAFAWFLDSVLVEDGYGDRENLLLTCQVCGENICAIDGGDTLRVLLNTALAHSCQT